VLKPATVPTRSQYIETKAKNKQIQHQTVLNDFENTKQLVKKLQRLQDGHSTKKRKRSPLESTSAQVKPRASTGKDLPPIVISSRPSSISFSLASQMPKGSTHQSRLDTNPDELSKPSLPTCLPYTARSTINSDFTTVSQPPIHTYECLCTLTSLHPAYPPTPIPYYNRSGIKMDAWAKLQLGQANTRSARKAIAGVLHHDNSNNTLQEGHNFRLTV